MILLKNDELLDFDFKSNIFKYMAIATVTKNKIFIPKTEYLRLKKLEKQFGDFLAYFENIIDIRQAREEIKQKKVIPQEKLFKQLGF